MVSSATGLYPWLGWQATERISVWGVVGGGPGALELMPDAGSALRSGLGAPMAAAGAREAR